jgi:hypothetical protein
MADETSLLHFAQEFDEGLSPDKVNRPLTRQNGFMSALTEHVGCFGVDEPSV